MGTISQDNRALLQKVAMIDDFVEFRDRELVLANDFPVTDIDALAYRYAIDYADAQEALIREPALKDLGDEFPEISVSEISEGSGVLQGRGFMVKFEPRVLYYKTGESKVVRTKRKIARYLGQLIERSVWNVLVGGSSTDGTPGCGTTGAQFDTYFADVGIEGGYATSGSPTGQIGLVCTAGNEWDNGGNILRQIRKVATLMQGQNLIQGTQAYEKYLNPQTSVMVMDSLSYGVLYDELLSAKLSTIEVGLNMIKVPGLMGLTFTQANYAVYIGGTYTFAGKANADGYAVIYDRNELPVQGYQSLPPLEGYTRSGDIDAGNVDMLIRTDYDKLGNYEIRFQFMYAFALEDPKAVIVWAGLRA